ncbi:hypothetical protein EVAR_81637_1 [Eumeta japonica]|uniref:Uncharacterized protein n=1 Tax=Eumeta variegata TaxID=151549 RepID=A0A4C1WCE9_EUMVA|nr:hypothetical protein EVAR_81637_1 [Eumeta japonica]
MELEGGHRNSVIKRRNPIEFELVFNDAKELPAQTQSSNVERLRSKLSPEIMSSKRGDKNSRRHKFEYRKRPTGARFAMFICLYLAVFSRVSEIVIQRRRCLFCGATCVATFVASHLHNTSRAVASGAESETKQKYLKHSVLKDTYHLIQSLAKQLAHGAIEGLGYSTSDPFRFELLRNAVTSNSSAPVAACRHKTLFRRQKAVCQNTSLASDTYTPELRIEGINGFTSLSPASAGRPLAKIKVRYKRGVPRTLPVETLKKDRTSDEGESGPPEPSFAERKALAEATPCLYSVKVRYVTVRAGDYRAASELAIK